MVWKSFFAVVAGYIFVCVGFSCEAMIISEETKAISHDYGSEISECVLKMLGQHLAQEEVFNKIRSCECAINVVSEALKRKGLALEGIVGLFQSCGLSLRVEKSSTTNTDVLAEKIRSAVNRNIDLKIYEDGVDEKLFGQLFKLGVFNGIERKSLLCIDLKMMSVSEISQLRSSLGNNVEFFIDESYLNNIDLVIEGVANVKDSLLKERKEIALPFFLDLLRDIGSNLGEYANKFSFARDGNQYLLIRKNAIASIIDDLDKYLGNP